MTDKPITLPGGALPPRSEADYLTPGGIPITAAAPASPVTISGVVGFTGLAPDPGRSEMEVGLLRAELEEARRHARMMQTGFKTILRNLREVIEDGDEPEAPAIIRSALGEDEAAPATEAGEGSKL